MLRPHEEAIAAWRTIGFNFYNSSKIKYKLNMYTYLFH